MNDSSLLALQRQVEQQARAEELLGDRAWFLLKYYGKLMDGPRSGRYVSGLPGEEQVDLAERLVAGQVLHIHLMHRHRSGNYKVSSLRWEDGRLVMVYKDRERVA